MCKGANCLALVQGFENMLAENDIAFAVGEVSLARISHSFRREAAEVLVSMAFRPRCRRVVLEARRRRRRREKRRAGE